MDNFDDLLARATERIGAEYFLLRVFGGDPIYRERVYCYELYHQLRSVWPDETRYSLNGELDKGGHPTLRSKISALKPDLLVHVTGIMDNFAAIEVKVGTPDDDGIRKDLRSLSALMGEADYRRGVFLIAGRQSDNIVGRIQELAAIEKIGMGVEIWVHPEPNSPAIGVATISIAA